jgi:hypothetical protein
LENSNCIQDNVLSNQSSTTNNDNSDIDDDLEELIKIKSQTPSLILCQPTNTGEVQKFLLIESFGLIPRLHHKTDILQWWISQKIFRPELYKLAVTVLAVPSTQVRFNLNLI